MEKINKIIEDIKVQLINHQVKTNFDSDFDLIFEKLNELEAEIERLNPKTIQNVMGCFV